MPTLQQQAKNRTVSDIINIAVSYSCNDTVRVLTRNGFASEFPYGSNCQKAENILLQLYYNNERLFWKIIKEINVDSSKVPPAIRNKYNRILPPNSAQRNLEEWWKNLVGGLQLQLQESTTEGVEAQTTTETPASAYIAYALITLSIFAIAMSLMRKG